MREIDARAFDLDLCFQNGFAFLNNGRAFFDKLPSEVNHAAQVIATQRAEFVVAATNLVLGVELLLKSLAIARMRRVLPTHDLIKLYEHLPSDYRSSVEKQYEKELGNAGGDALSALVIHIWPKGTEPPIGKDTGPIGGRISIRSVLQSESDAFRIWRYMHESGKPHPVALVFRHYYLITISAALTWHFLFDSINGRIAKTQCSH